MVDERSFWAEEWDNVKKTAKSKLGKVVLGVLALEIGSLTYFGLIYNSPTQITPAEQRGYQEDNSTPRIDYTPKVEQRIEESKR